MQASAPEARDMLERGVADAITFPWGSIFLFGIDRAVKYHIDAPIYTTVFTFVMNKARYDGMTLAQRSVIDSHCTTAWAEKIAGPWVDFEAAGRDRMRATAGHEVYPLSPEQLAAWKGTVAPLQKNWAAAVAQVGVDPRAAAAELQASLAKYDAGF